jgi:hypothetical protein
MNRELSSLKTPTVAVNWKADVDVRLRVTEGQLVSIVVQGTSVDLTPRSMPIGYTPRTENAD